MAEDNSNDWISSDLWKQDTDTNWAELDYFVGQGYMTPHERDLCHAYESLVYSDQPTGNWENGEYNGSYKAANEAWVKFGTVETEHKDDPVFGNSPDLPPPTYDHNGPTSDYNPPVVDVPLPPKVPGDGGDGKFNGPGKISVNTQALKTFADNLETLRTSLAQSAGAKVKDLDIKPGAFSVAYAMRRRIAYSANNADKVLKNDLHEYFRGLDIELANIRDAVRKLVADYDNTEDLNKLGADKLNTIMTEPFSYIDQNAQNPSS